MAFTSETKNGYVDGEHFGNHGDSFPLFARVVNGVLYAVAREDRAGAERFGSVFFVSPEWLKSSAFAARKSDADYFADKPNGAADNSQPGSLFVRTANTEALFKSPTPTTPVAATNPIPAVVVAPAVVPPATPAITVPVQTLAAQPSVTSAETFNELPTSGMTTTMKVLIGVAVAAVVGAVIYFISKKK